MLDALKDLIRPIIRPPLHRPEIKLSYRVYGTRYGAWPLLDRNRTPVMLSFGVGEDISFDLEAIKLGIAVHAFDPTPRCHAWIAKQTLPPAFNFHPYGIAAQDGHAEFHPPSNPEHVSYSARAGVDQSAPAVSVPVFRLGTIVDRLNMSAVDTLKLDIEGFEYDVVEDLIQNGPLPTELLIEFHHSMYGYEGEATQSAVSKLRSVGYKLYYVSASGHEYAFVRQ